MALDTMTAAQAYTQAVNRAQNGSSAGEGAAAGESFADMVARAAGETQASLNSAEQLTQAGAAGQANLVEVVTAVTAAEASLETVMAVRDQVVRAYQDVIRMPI